MIDHELTDPSGGALTITHDYQGVWITATDTRDEVTVGPFPARALRASFDMGDDLADGGVTAAAIEAEVVSPERARSLVQENTRLRERIGQAEEEMYAARRFATREHVRATRAEQERAATEPRPLTADTSKVTRVAVIGPKGINYERRDLYVNGARIEIQDGGRTLKIFPARHPAADSIQELIEGYTGPGGPDFADFLAERGVRVTGAES